MDMTTILAAVEEEIALFQQVRAVLSDDKAGGRGEHAAAIAFSIHRPQRRHVISKEGRARIAAAQKRRWAKQKANKRTSQEA